MPHWPFIPHQTFTFEAIVKAHQLRVLRSPRLLVEQRETIDSITSHVPLSLQAVYYTSLYSYCR